MKIWEYTHPRFKFKIRCKNKRILKKMVEKTEEEIAKVFNRGFSTKSKWIFGKEGE